MHVLLIFSEHFLFGMLDQHVVCEEGMLSFWNAYIS